MDDVADVLGAAYAESEQIREQARAEGEAAGRADGLAAVRAEIEHVAAGRWRCGRGRSRTRARSLNAGLASAGG